MKLFKELPKSIFQSLYLLTIPKGKLYNETKKRVPIIISLTSIPSRLNVLPVVIRGLMSQTVDPKKIILWLNKGLDGTIPSSLLNLQNELFEIRFSELDCPHLKLVETLESFPNDIIITCDDDSIYDFKLVENLYKEHLKSPKAIVANVTREVTPNIDKGGYVTYSKWKYGTFSKSVNSHIFPLGVGGVLYPPKSFHPSILDRELFLKLTPKSDDMWFKVMSVLNNTESKQAEHVCYKPIPVLWSQKISLKKENVKKNKNDLQWEKLNKYYELEQIF